MGLVWFHQEEQLWWSFHLSKYQESTIQSHCVSNLFYFHPPLSRINKLNNNHSHHTTSSFFSLLFILMLHHIFNTPHHMLSLHFLPCIGSPNKTPIWLCDVSTATQKQSPDIVCLHVGLTKGCLQSFLAFCPPPLLGPIYVLGGGYTANRAVLASLCQASVIL